MQDKTRRHLLVQANKHRAFARTYQDSDSVLAHAHYRSARVFEEYLAVLTKEGTT